MAGIPPMLDEFSQLRAPPPHPYSLNDAVLELPINALRATEHLLVAAGRREACVFWYGSRDGDFSRVTSVRAPRQTATRYNYHVDEAAMSLMSQTLEDDCRPVAQIHSHPGRNVEHSRYDDQMIASRRALSLVFPDYGRLAKPWPCGIGVHEWQEGYWHLLNDFQAVRRVRLVADADISVQDLR